MCLSLKGLPAVLADKSTQVGGELLQLGFWNLGLGDSEFLELDYGFEKL